MKATQAVIAKRVSEVLAIRLGGAQFHDIVRYAAEQNWGVKERQLWNYVQASDRLLVQRQERDRDKLFAQHVARRMALFARCLNAEDYSTAGRVLRDEAELLGLYPSADDALRRESEALRQQLAELQGANREGGNGTAAAGAGGPGERGEGAAEPGPGA
jgi:hypothetical protein